MRTFIPALVVTAVLTVITGIVYPLAVWGIAQTIFPAQAGGSLVVAGNKVVGSSLIGQNFSSPRYFQSRPSAAGDKGYDAANSSGLESRAHQQGADRRGQVAAEELHREQSRHQSASGSGGPGDGFRQRPRSRDKSRRRRPPGGACCPRARHKRRSGPAVDCREHAAAIGGNLRRAGRKRSATEPRPRSRRGKSWRNSRDLNG